MYIYVDYLHAIDQLGVVGVKMATKTMTMNKTCHIFGA